MMYRLNDREQIEHDIKIKTKPLWQYYCDLNLNYLESDYKFCMCECELEGCTGQYHRYTTEVIQEEQEVEIGTDEFENPIYEMQMVDVDIYTYLIDPTDLLSVEEYKLITFDNIKKPQTLSEIKTAIDLLKDEKSLWFNFDGHNQRFNEKDIAFIKLTREGLIDGQQLYDVNTGVALKNEDESPKLGKPVPFINWSYPDPIDSTKREYIKVEEPGYFTAMLTRGGFNLQICFEAERLTLAELYVCEDLSIFNYETVFNGYYDVLVASHI